MTGENPASIIVNFLEVFLIGEFNWTDYWGEFLFWKSKIFKSSITPKKVKNLINFFSSNFKKHIIFFQKNK
jgi:hypothetical protein